MKVYVLDASAVLRFTDREPGFERVRALYEQAAQGAVRLLMSAVNWGEVVTAILRRSGAQAEVILDNLAALPMGVVPVDRAKTSDAGRCKCRYGIPYADAFAASLTLRLQGEEGGATLVTADNDFRRIPDGTIRIEFLPGK